MKITTLIIAILALTISVINSTHRVEILKHELNMLNTIKSLQTCQIGQLEREKSLIEDLHDKNASIETVIRGSILVAHEVEELMKWRISLEENKKDN